MVSFKASINERSLRLLLGKISKRVERNIKKVLKEEALPHLVDLIMVGFDSLSDRANILPEDPTNPANWREVFRVSLLEDVQRTFSVSGSHVEVNIGDKEFLGYTPTGEPNDPNDNEGLPWMVYYLEGLAGDWAFISPDLYEQLRGSGSFDSTWGRFGEGFMISKDQFDQEGWGSIISFDQVRHPFSGFAPVDIFLEATREFSLHPFINKAILASIKGRDL